MFKGISFYVEDTDVTHVAVDHLKANGAKRLFGSPILSSLSSSDLTLVNDLIKRLSRDTRDKKNEVEPPPTPRIYKRATPIGTGLVTSPVAKKKPKSYVSYVSDEESNGDTKGEDERPKSALPATQPFRRQLYTEEEDKKLLDLIAGGISWSAIEQNNLLPGRTVSSMTHRYNKITKSAPSKYLKHFTEDDDKAIARWGWLWRHCIHPKGHEWETAEQFRVANRSQFNIRGRYGKLVAMHPSLDAFYEYASNLKVPDEARWGSFFKTRRPLALPETAATTTTTTTSETNESAEPQLVASLPDTTTTTTTTTSEPSETNETNESTEPKLIV
jgi:hypothetical protein